ncbi:MAG: hypothetical protein LUQ31_02520 [Methanoregula sp.]|nr:hypothetical protein [Methanoregula sp.]
MAITGCSSNSNSNSNSTAQTNTSSTITTETTVGPLYTAGDIVKSSTGSTSTGWLIISYDSATDSYTRAFIYKNSNGSWGYRINSNTETSKRSVLEKVYTVLVTHVTVSSIPTQAPTTATTVTTAVTTVTATTTSVTKPSIKDMDPDEGNTGDSVTTVITGTNFKSGVTARLHKSGETNITASDVSWDSATQLTCTFAIPSNTTVGAWDIVVTNPDGGEGKYSNFFTVHEDTDSSDDTTTTTTTTGSNTITITNIDPPTVVASATTGWYGNLKIYGSGIESGANVTLSNDNYADITGTNIYMPDSSTLQVSFTILPGRQGTWDVTVTNLDGDYGTLSNALTVN